MAMPAYAEVIEFPAFLTRQRPVVPYPEDLPCDGIKARPGDLMGAAGRFLRFARHWFADGIAARVSNMRNGQGMTSIHEVSTAREQRARMVNGQPAVEPHSREPAPSPRSLVDDVALAVNRLRLIEGERGLYNMLEQLLQGSRAVLIQHGVMPPANAEIESLHIQLKRLQASRDTAVAYAKLYQDTLAEIAKADDDASAGVARKALEVVLEGIQQPQPPRAS